MFFPSEPRNWSQGHYDTVFDIYDDVKARLEEMEDRKQREKKQTQKKLAKVS